MALSTSWGELRPKNSPSPARFALLGFSVFGCAMADDRQSSAQRGYGSKWQRARKAWLLKHPLCKMHADRGLVVAATVVDHIIPHRGDMTLFWDRNNWQSLCKACHDTHKQRLEKSGAVVGCDMSGIPIDPSHPWRGGHKKSGGSRS